MLNFLTKSVIRVVLVNSRPHRISNILYTSLKMTDSSSNPGEADSSKYSVLNVNDWSENWQVGKIGFHKANVHPLLMKYADKLTGGKSAQNILIPLCGKSQDIKWIADQGHTVVGVEAVEQAVLEFFSEQNIEYNKETLADIPGDLYKSSDGRISIYRCDMFDFNRSYKEKFDAVYDRAALVAINRDDRERYATLVKSLSGPGSRMLIITVNYDPTLHPGPPHFVEDGVIPKLYGSQYNVEILEHFDSLEERWRDKGLTYFDEVVHFLTYKS